MTPPNTPNTAEAGENPSATPTDAKSADAASPVVRKHKYGFFRRMLRGVFWSFLLTFTALSIVLAGALAWLNSDAGRYWLVDAINHSGVATLKSIEGSFWSELQIKQLHVKTEAVVLDLDYGVLRWEPYLLLFRELSLPLVSLGKLAIHLPAAPPDQPPSTPPTSLTLPFSLHLAQFKIAQLQVDGTLLQDIDASISSNGRFHRINLSQLRLPQGSLSAAFNLTGKAPFQSAGSFIFAGQLAGQSIETFGQVEGPLRQLQLETTIRHEQLSGQAKLELDAFAPYAYQLVKHGNLALKGFDPALWSADAPQAKLDLDASFIPNATGMSGQIALKNQLIGAIDQKKIPLRSAEAQFQLRDQVLHIDALQLTLGSRGKIAASGQVQQGQLDLNISAQQLDPQQFWSPQPAGEMGGQIRLSGPWLAPNIKGEISDVGRKAKLKLDVGWLNPKTEKRLAIHEAQLSRGDSLIVAKGEFNLLARNDFSAGLELKKINPAEFAKVPAGSISGKANLKGELQPIPRIDLQYELSNSQFNQQALAGAGQLKLAGERLNDSDFWLSLGANKISAKGSFGQASDQLKLVLDMPSLSVLGPKFSGSITGDAQVSGTLQQAKAKAHLVVKNFHTPFDLQIDTANFDVAISSQLQAPLLIDGQINGLRLGETQLTQVKLSGNGTLQQHELGLVLAGKQGTLPLLLNTRVRGGLSAEQRWQGQITALDGSAGLPFKLGNTPGLRLASDFFALDATSLSLGQSVIQLQNTQWKNGELTSQGQIQNLHVADVLSLTKIKNISSDLVLAGQWQVQKTDVLNAKLNVNRVSGDVQWQEDGRKLPLTLNTLQLNTQVVMNKASVVAKIVSTQFGDLALSGDGILDLERGTLLEQAPLNLAIKGSLPNLAVLAPFIGSDVKLTGKADLDLRRAGLLNVAKWTGQMRVADLNLSDPNSGVALRDGQIELGMQDSSLVLRSLKLKDGGKGEISGSGALDFGAKDGLAGGVKIVANHFTLISKPDMLLVMSGQGGVDIQGDAIQVTGNFKADEGDIQFKDADTPRLSSDVRVLGREKTEKSASNTKLALLFDFDLGDNFKFRGYGLESRLTGKLRLKAQPNQLLSATGSVITEDGEYRAYGQKLDVERGILSFSGPIDNPSLDILAIRRNQAVEAGVRVQGTAYSPRVTLYSEPSVPDAEKISWLLFGHGSDTMEKSDSALVLQLLNAMASNGGGGQGLTDEILANFGIDEVGYKSKQETDGSTTQIVTVSKRLTKNLRVGLEKSFNGLSDAVSFTLQLTRNWSVVSRIGVDESSLDVNYTISYD